MTDAPPPGDLTDEGWTAIPRWLLYSNAPRDAKLVYLVINSHVGTSGDSWPGYGRIADEAGCSRRQAMLMVDWLAKHALISVERRQDPRRPHRNLTNVYRVIAGSPISFPERPKHTRAKPDTSAPDAVVHDVHQGGATAAPEVVHDVHPNESQLNESQRTRTTPPAPRAADTPSKSNGTYEEQFSQFWTIYPIRVAKAAAKSAFIKVIRDKKIPLETVLDGVRRYRDDPNRDPSFTAHPATWLNQGRWDDDPLPPRAEDRRVPEPTYDPAKGRTIW